MVVASPQRLKICIMEAQSLLRGIGEIKAGAWADTIDMPIAMILPCHAGLE
jgi:hypothetical protein